MNNFPEGSVVHVIGFELPKMTVMTSGGGYVTVQYLDTNGVWQKTTFDARQLELIPAPAPASFIPPEYLSPESER